MLSLRSLCVKRQYAEIASLLQGVGRVMEHFTPYLDIPQVKQLADQVKFNLVSTRKSFGEVRFDIYILTSFHSCKKSTRRWEIR